MAESSMAEDGFEEWDPEFWDKLIQVEERVLSSTQQQPLPPPPQLVPSHTASIISYSPPRELSKRTVDFSSQHISHSFDVSVDALASQSVRPPACRQAGASLVEINELKGELGRVSKQLMRLEQECAELRKERDLKEEQLKSVFGQGKSKDVEVLKHKTTEPGVLGEGCHTTFLDCHNVNGLNKEVGTRLHVAPLTSKARSPKPDQEGVSSPESREGDVSNSRDVFKKLLAIWDNSSIQRSERHIISSLLMSCSTDLGVLFGFLNTNLSSQLYLDSFQKKVHCDVATQSLVQCVHSSETAKVSYVYTVLTKISSGMARVEALVEPLLDLCNIENAVIVHSSLRILHVALDHLLSLERKFVKRENVLVEECCSTSDVADLRRYESGKPHLSYRCFHGIFDGATISTSCIDWVSLFTLMAGTALKHSEERVRYEAITIMNLILLRSSAYEEREKFGQPVVFECVSQLTRKEAGFRVQKQALHLLFLLLNCPKLLAMFSEGCGEEARNSVTTNDDLKGDLAFRVFNSIPEGVADCVVATSVNGAVGLKLCRKAITLLAFLGSSGNSGFEVVVNDKLSIRGNFLLLILRALASELEVEAAGSVEPSEIVKERTMLIREALIFLNRLVSSPVYSVTVLRVLTSAREVTSLAVDIVNRLSRKDPKFERYDDMIRQTRESEIVELARVFKKRLFSYLGETIS